MRNRKYSLFSLAMFALSAAANAQMQLKLDAQGAQNFGVRTEILVASEQMSAHVLDARALDPSPLYVQVADIEQSRSALALSSAQLARITRLYRNQQNATQASLAQATLAAQTDQNNLARAQTALRASWGDAVLTWPKPEIARRMRELRAGRASLVRAELDAALPPLAVFRAGDATLELISLLPSADAQTGRAGALLWLSRGLPAQSRLQVQISAGSAGLSAAPIGVLIPRSAILRINGGSFVFVQTAADTYAMRELTAPERRADGWLVPAGFSAGERVVTAGAASLLTMARGAGAEE